MVVIGGTLSDERLKFLRTTCKFVSLNINTKRRINVASRGKKYAKKIAVKKIFYFYESIFTYHTYMLIK